MNLSSFPSTVALKIRVSNLARTWVRPDPESGAFFRNLLDKQARVKEAQQRYAEEAAQFNKTQAEVAARPYAALIAELRKVPEVAENIELKAGLDGLDIKWHNGITIQRVICRGNTLVRRIVQHLDGGMYEPMKKEWKDLPLGSTLVENVRHCLESIANAFEKSPGYLSIMKIALAFILVVCASAASAQTKSKMQAQSDSNCTVAKCRQIQAGKGYAPEQTANWCPKNLHRGCI